MSQPLHVVFALFPRVTQLDFTGAYEVMWRLPGAVCMLGSAAGGAIEADGGMVFQTRRLADIAACDILIVSGGYGIVDAIGDQDLLVELRRLGGLAQHVSSVCSGSLALAAAGMLNGHRAAGHWAWRDLLRHFDGVTPDAGRVVRDGRIITGGGVTAGIDMALTLAAEIAGEAYAKAVQLAIEYAPAPPFDCGRPELAEPAVLAAVNQRIAAMGSARERAVQQAAAKLRDAQPNA